MSEDMPHKEVTRYGPVRGKPPGVAAIDIDGSRYCIDCAGDVLDGKEISVKLASGEWEDLQNADGRRVADELVSGEIETLGMGGVVLAESTDMDEVWHCDRGKECKNSPPGDDDGCILKI